MSRKVWVIEDGEYSDYRVVGVFSSKKNAQAVRDHIKEGTVSEWTLDPVVAEVNAGRVRFNVTMLRDGTVERCEPSSMGTYNLEGSVDIWERTKAPAYKGRGIPDAMTATVWATSKEHAIKIVNEHRGQWIAEGRWKS